MYFCIEKGDVCMQFSESFQGWLGEFGKEATYESMNPIIQGILSNFQNRIAPGQKIAIGYDTRVFSKTIAQHIAVSSAEKSMKVFFSDAPVPSAVLVESCVRKKCIGAIVVTGDAEEGMQVGIRAYSQDGMLLMLDDIGNYEFTQKEDVHPFSYWSRKGYIEGFDPSICYFNRMASHLSFAAVPHNANWMMLNPLFGSTMLFLEDMLSQQLSEHELNGYTMNGDHLSEIHSITPVPSLHVAETITEMLAWNTSLGFIVSPDGFSFECIIEDQSLEKQIFIERLIAFHQNDSKPVLISSKWQSQLSASAVSSVTVIEDEKFTAALQKPFACAVDEKGYVYAQSIPVPDAIYAGLCFFLMENGKSATRAQSDTQIKL